MSAKFNLTDGEQLTDSGRSLIEWTIERIRNGQPLPERSGRHFTIFVMRSHVMSAEQWVAQMQGMAQELAEFRSWVEAGSPEHNRDVHQSQNAYTARVRRR